MEPSKQQLKDWLAEQELPAKYLMVRYHKKRKEFIKSWIYSVGKVVEIIESWREGKFGKEPVFFYDLIHLDKQGLPIKMGK